VTSKEIDFMPEAGHWWPKAKEINIRLSAHANPYSGYRLLGTVVHEMLHVYVTYRNSVDRGRYPVGSKDFVTLRSGKRKSCSHGEIFGSESRRINQNYPVLDLWEAQYGLPRKDRLYWVWSARRRADVAVPYAVKTRLRRRWARRSERWAEEREEKARFWQTPEGKAKEAERKAEHEALVKAMQAERLAEKEAKRRKRADAFRKRIDAMTDDQRIAALRKQLENPKTPRQFIPSIEAKLKVLEQKLETVAGD
jgi:hypothetical protein